VVTRPKPYFGCEGIASCTNAAFRWRCRTILQPQLTLREIEGLSHYTFSGGLSLDQESSVLDIQSLRQFPALNRHKQGCCGTRVMAQENMNDHLVISAMADLAVGGDVPSL
jgi:hypothetical protein